MLLANGNLEVDGMNEGSYSFASPAPLRLNTTIGRCWITFPATVIASLFAPTFRTTAPTPPEQFPGQTAQRTDDTSKGIIGGETWPSPTTLINDLRYGYIRQG